jgi:S1-C subfamily serine protease
MSGLAAGDVITAVAGHSASSQATLQTVMVNDVGPGQRVTVQCTDTTGCARRSRPRTRPPRASWIGGYRQRS